MVSAGFHPKARDEFLAAYSWYKARSASAAPRFRQEVREAVRRIRSAPSSFPPIDQRFRFVMLNRFPYRLVYELIGDHVTIFAVAHDSREPGYWKHRK